MLVRSQFSDIISAKLKKYHEDFCAGKIPIPHDDDCLDDCSEDHGYFTLPDKIAGFFE